jgi:hypothetical protein
MRVHRLSREDDVFAAIQIEYTETEANEILTELADACQLLNWVPRLAELRDKIRTVFR